MGYQEKNGEEGRVKSSVERRRRSPLSRRQSSPRSSSLRNRSVSPGRSNSSGERWSRFHEQEGDLFSAPLSSSLAHCVSSDMKMSAGIAVHFKRKFGQVEELLSQGKQVGEVAYLRDGRRYIFYLVTKNRYHDKPTESSLQKSLVELKHLCQKLIVKKLAMPRIGCGLDGLDWVSVSSIIQKVFSGSATSITIYSIERRSSGNRSFSSYSSNRRELLHLVWSEPPLRRRDDRDKRSRSRDQSNTPLKRPRIEASPTQLLAVLKKTPVQATTSGRSSSQHEHRPKKSQWETDSSSSSASSSSSSASSSSSSVSSSSSSSSSSYSSSSSSSEEDGTKSKASKTAPHGKVRKQSRPDSSVKEKRVFKSIKVEKEESKSQNKPYVSDKLRSNDKVVVPKAHRVESLVAKPIQTQTGSSALPPKQSDPKSSKSSGVTWDISSDNNSGSPNLKEKKSSSSIIQSMPPPKDSESIHCSRKRKSSVSNVLKSNEEEETPHQEEILLESDSSPERKRKRLPESIIHKTHSDQNIIKNTLSPSSSDKEANVLSYQHFEDDPLPRKKLIIQQRIHHDYLSASDEETDEEQLHFCESNGDSPLNQTVSRPHRIFIMDSPERPQRKGLSQSLKGRLGAPVNNMKRLIKFHEDVPEEAPVIRRNIHIQKNTARRSLPIPTGTMYSDRETTKLSIKDRLARGCLQRS